jgi:hypothetical protein
MLLQSAEFRATVRRVIVRGEGGLSA